MKKGFTLAEVLITLGIIGVVSAMTIPTLIQNYNTKAWNTAALVFEKKLEDAIKVMNSQSTLAGYNTTEEFVEELTRHFKASKICPNDKLAECFSNVVFWGGGNATPKEVDMNIIKTSRNLGQTKWETNIVGVQFANGTNALIAYNPNCEQDPLSNQITGQNCFAILYDTSGEKNPNTIGKDLRSNSNVTKLGNGCAFEIGDTCYALAPFNAEPVTLAECQTMIETHGIKACEYDNDYWAGAVKACGGVSKMPSLTQLGKLADYLYNISGTGTKDTVSNITLDKNKAMALGFDLSSSGSFSIHSKEYGAATSYFRTFKSTSTSASTGRRYNNWVTICLD